MSTGFTFTEQERSRIREKAGDAHRAIKANVRKFDCYPSPLLIAGAMYSGIWLEHNQDNIFLASEHPEAAWASQQVFMDHQREDGLLPFMFQLAPSSGNASMPSPARYWHIQGVYSFAACALEIAEKTGKGESTFAEIYRVASKYDDWFVTHRNRSGSGLVEMYCEWDTGHDNSPRVRDGGIPETCPGNEASNMPNLPIMPILSVDLSAYLYGGRIALAELARRLSKGQDESLWREKAEELAHRMHELLYDPEDDFYYDRDTTGFRKYRSEHITRLFLNGALSKSDFDRIFDRYFTDPKEFWPQLPIPSMSVSDPSVVKGYPGNCWGANSQALTTLRALKWLEDYGRLEERKDLMGRWLRAYLDHDNPFTQEMHPLTGAPIGGGTNYTPAAIVFLRSAQEYGIIGEHFHASTTKQPELISR